MIQNVQTGSFLGATDNTGNGAVITLVESGMYCCSIRGVVKWFISLYLEYILGISVSYQVNNDRFSKVKS